MSDVQSNSRMVRQGSAKSARAPGGLSALFPAAVCLLAGCAKRDSVTVGASRTTIAPTIRS